MIHDVAIVGGGICGLSIGWKLAKRGLRVLILEKGEAGHGATWAALGILFPRVGDDPRGPAFTKLCVESHRLWPTFAKEVESESGIEIDYGREGTLLPAFEAREEDQLRRQYALLRKSRVGAKWVSGKELRSLEPNMSYGVKSALFNPLVHRVDNRKLALALKKAFLVVGDFREKTSVAKIVIQGGRVIGVSAGGSTIRAHKVIIAAGAWSAGIPGLDERIRPPVRPVKGQVISVKVPEGRRLLSHVIHYADTFLVQRGDGRLLIGATVEERGFDTKVTAGAISKLLTVALAVIPDIDTLPLGEAWAGTRPGSPDGAPILGGTNVEGLVMATGHFRNGILLAPITADLVSEYVISDKLPALAQPFTMNRFSN